MNYIQTSGDFDKLEPAVRSEAQHELMAFLERERIRLPDLHLHAHLERLNGSLGSNVLLGCTLHLTSDKTRFTAVEQGFGIEAAISNALLALRYQIDKQREIQIESRQKVEGRKAMPAEV